MRLKELIKGLKVKETIGEGNPEIVGLTYDSRKVDKGFAFFALIGSKDDGHRYIPPAVERGAKVIVAQKESFLGKEVIQIIVEDSRSALSILAEKFYLFPSQVLKVWGVTGTTGKTTITYLIESILKEAKKPCGVIGTISYRLGERVISALNTTPESLDLSYMLAEMKKEGIEVGLLEVSSQGISQGRITNIAFDGAIFSNIFPFEHLDYHKTMRNYLKSKLSLFDQYLVASPKKEKRGIINLDSPYSKHFIRACKLNQISLITYGFSKKAMVRGEEVLPAETGFSIKIKSPWGEFSLCLPLFGTHNLYNSLAAVSFGFSQGFSPEVIREGLQNIGTIPGRLEPISAGQPFKLFVDYAHTEAALSNLLSTVRGLTKKRVILLFGCGGDRDRRKRPLMGKVGARMADYVVLTSDNPRSEDPLSIIKDIKRGLGWMSRKRFEVILERREAIERALRIAKEGDVVVLAGKGHETYQLFKERVIPFDDRLIARKILENIYGRGES